MSERKGDVKQSTVERMRDDLVRSSGGRLTGDQAQRIARESAERVNRERREKR